MCAGGKSDITSYLIVHHEANLFLSVRYQIEDIQEKIKAEAFCHLSLIS